MLFSTLFKDYIPQKESFAERDKELQRQTATHHPLFEFADVLPVVGEKN